MREALAQPPEDDEGTLLWLLVAFVILWPLVFGAVSHLALTAIP